MLQIVIPMAGRGSRFAEAGYDKPKPLIPVHGVPMIRWVIENIRPDRPHRFVFICQVAHVAQYGLEAELKRWSPGCEVVPIDGITEGAACTVLTARRVLPPDAPLMIANSDQFVECDINDYLAAADRADLDGLIMTMGASDPKWSFVALDKGLVTRVVEKEVISNVATVGIYNFRRCGDFIEAADAMIADDERVNGEFYVAPVYNRLIKAGRRIGVHAIGQDQAGMHGLGIPPDLEAFLATDLSRAYVGRLA